MRDQQSRPSGRRPRRGGPGPRRNGNTNRNGGSARRREPAPKREEPKTLWQKIVAFFGGGAKSGKPTPSAPRADRSGNSRPKRKPEFVEVTSPKLYVGNLSFDATESDLSELFNGVGSVQSAEVVWHRDTQRSKGFAFVTMGTTEEAQRAVEVLHDQAFMGRNLVVSGAKTNDMMHCR